jgi:hypothetical protein
MANCSGLCLGICFPFIEDPPFYLLCLAVCIANCDVSGDP